MSSDYEFLTFTAQVCQVLAWIAIVVGASLRHDGARKNLGTVAEVLGWAAFFASGIVGSQTAAAQALDCSLWGRDCIRTDAEAWDYVWEHLLSGIVTDLVVGATAELVGWSIARLRRRRRPIPDQPT